MPRAVDHQRKPQLLSAILEYFEDKPLAGLSFRTLARSLGVSSYALVYHFGNRAQLITEIVRAIAERQKSAESAEAALTIDQHIGQLRASFEWALARDNLRLQRLEFEAAMIEALAPSEHSFTKTTFAYWMDETARTLQALGLDAHTAAIESRIINSSFYGFQYDLVVNGEREAASEAFDVMLDRHRQHLTQLIDGT